METHLAECEDCKRRQQALSSIAFSKTMGSSKDGQPTRAEGAGGAGTGLTRGATLGRYVLLEKLGAGGMGEVFAAYDPQLDRKVAVKLLRGGALSAEEGKARLLREAQAMARLQHPNVIAVHDVGVLNDRVFVAMEYVDGETLADWLRQPREWDEVVRIFTQAGTGLAAAHRAGLVHRDFKPDNVLIGSDGRPRVLDFGLARQSTATPAPTPQKELEQPSDPTLNARLTRDGAVMGTPGYMAPEQISGLATDARSDQFSFCVALWEGLFGQRPFSGSTLRQHAAEIALGRVGEAPSDSRVPSWVIDVVRTGLAANPQDRWPDMDALLKALRPRGKGSARRNLFVVGLVLFSLFGIGYGAWTRQRLLVCGGSESRLAGVWDTARKAKLKAGFIATNLSYAGESWTNSERALDAWAAEWVATARDVCEASKLRKSDSPEVTDLKNACLDERLQRLDALVALFDAPDHDVVNNAPLAARDLERAMTCTSANALRKATTLDEKEKTANDKLRVRLAEGRALFTAGKYAAASEKLKEGLSPEASPASQAEALLWLARMEAKRGESKLARNANLLASEQALKSGDATLIARAFSRLYANEGYDEGDSDADTWSRLAAAAAARAPGDWEVQVELAQNDAFVSLRRKRYKAALADFEQVLALQKEHLGAEHPDVASTLNNLGVALVSSGRTQEAVARYEESLVLHEKLEGSEHPNVAVALHNLAVALRRMGQAQVALTTFERALAIRRKALGFNHVESLNTAMALVKLRITLGELEPARALLDEVKETRITMSGADSVQMIPVVELETELYLAGAYWKEALESAQRHAQLSKLNSGESARAQSMSLIEQAMAWTQLGSWNDARKALGEVQKRLQPGNRNPFDEGLYFEAVARLELAQGHDALAVPPLEKAVEQREEGNPIGAAKTSILLAQVLQRQGEVDRALTMLASAEVRFSEGQCTRLLTDAQLALAQALWLARPAEHDATAERFKTVLPQLSEAQKQTLNKWLSENAADAGVSF
ncbi:MAG: serine/threonine-protein kinase [Archangium sp.]